MLARDDFESRPAIVSANSQELFDSLSELLMQFQEHSEILDRDSQFPVREFDQLRAIGALSAVVPERFGGLGIGTEPSSTPDLMRLLCLMGRGNLAVGRVFEGHVNAITLIRLYGNERQLAAASRDACDGHLFAIWNTEAAPGLRVVGTRLKGSKIFCSAAGFATRALVTAITEDGESRMLLLPLPGGERLERLAGRLQGMRGAHTQQMVFDGFSIEPEAFIGISDDYTREPAFSTGAWRTSAVTVGGLEALVGEAMAQLVARGRDRNPHQQSRMGRAIIAQETARLWCSRAAVVAEDLGVDARQKTAYVNLARIAIESATLEALRLVQRSIGLVGFLEPNPIERLMRDLATYLRQPAADEALTEAAGWYLKHGNLQKPES